MSERSAVQNPMLKYADQIGWTVISCEEALALRRGDTGLFFADILEAQLLRLNPTILNTSRAADIIRQLNLLKPTIEGNRDALSWLQGEQSVFVPEENRQRNVTLIDFENPDNNIFHVTDEWWQRSTAFRNRADVMFLINGIPVAIAETKSPTEREGISKGVSQIRRYHAETPEMVTTAQVFDVTHLIEFYYGVTWSLSKKNLFNWKDEAQGDFENKVKTFFDRKRFLKVLRDYIVFLSKDDELSKVILRQHQTRAVEKVIERVYDATKRRGLIWHTQGSGKTLTMITIASKLLREAREAEKPTVLMLVDRNELESQLFKNIASYGISSVEVAQSKKDLQQLLAADRRGLIVSMVHKFDDVPADINTKESIVILVDEAHRTTGGDLGNYLMAALPNATYIGFTGTPIDKLAQGKGTFKVFGVDDAQGYLDKYSIAESIEDNTTVRLNYALAPSDMLVDRETLEKHFLSLADAEGVSDVEELNAILDRAVDLKEMMKAQNRVEMIAEYVAKHFKENVEPMGFKAFLVGVDREACALYKKALDKHLPADYSKVVYSPAHNDSLELKEYYLKEGEEKAVRNDFKKKTKLPKILIVTEKLLTGFDAPILYCLYLDKPMRDHVLLQTIARVNRPYEDDAGQTKPYGFVYDFVGIFERLEKALAFDSDEVASVIQNIDVLKVLFETLMTETAPKYRPLTKGWDDKAKERAITHFEEKKTRDEFYKFYKQTQNIYDILSPDAFLRPFMDDYQALAELYALIRNAYTERIDVDKELTAKTKELLRQHTGSTSLELPGAIHELGVKELTALKESDTSETIKVLNLRKLLNTVVREEATAKPFLLSIGERAEALAQAYEDRHLATQEALFEFEKLANEYVESEAERQKLNLDGNTFAIHTALKSFKGEIEVEVSKEINGAFGKYPDFEWNEQQKRDLRSVLYKLLIQAVGKEKMVEAAKTLLRLKRI
jgi:type I restriction enzyme R subunit